MKKSGIFKTYSPYILPVLLFLILAVLYFAPQYQGKVLSMHDDIQYVGMSQDIRVHNQLYDEDPQWTGNAFGGMPSYLNSIKYPSMIIRSAANEIANFIGNPTWMIFLAMVSFWIMLILLKFNPWVAFVPSIAYGFSTYSILIIGAGHLAKMMAFAYAPMLVGAVIYTFRSRHMLLGAMLTALFASLELAANHPQITYYFAIVIAAFWINELVNAIKDKTIPHFSKVTAMLLFAAVLAIGSNFAPLYYTAQHSPDTTRAGSELSAENGQNKNGLDLSYATAWSYGKSESFNMFIPYFKGGATASFKDGGEVAQALKPYRIKTSDGAMYGITSYWGEQPSTAGPTYIGAVIFFFAVLAMFIIKGRSKWWILIVSILALFLAWGRNMMWFTQLMFDILPGYNKFRAVATTLVIIQWSMPFLAAFALAKIYDNKTERKQLMHGLKWSTLITAGVALFFLLTGKILFSFKGIYDPQLPDDILQAMYAQRASMFTVDSLRSLILVLLSAATVWLFADHKLGKKSFITVCALLVCIDMIPVDLRFLPHSKFMAKQQTQITPTAADEEILKDKELGYRVANFSVSTFNDATTSYFHRSIGGYHGAKLQRYQDIIDRYLVQMSIPIYNMLNTKYFIIPNQETGQPEPQLNPEANGAAWFVEKGIPASSPNQEIDLLDKVNLLEDAVVAEKDMINFNGIESPNTTDTINSAPEITLTEYRPNYLKYEYNSPQKRVAVFSEIYYDKGWTAYIDGVQAPYFRADYILRAMQLPAGKHTVEFKFRAPNFNTISTITLIFSIIILVGLALSIYITIQNDKKNGTARKQEA